MTQGSSLALVTCGVAQKVGWLDWTFGLPVSVE